MKILIVHDYAELIGGAEMGAKVLRDGLRDRGHDARIFAAKTQSEAASMADYTCLGTVSRLRGLLQTANPWAHHQLAQVMADFRPDVVHVRMFLTQLSPLILPLLRKVPSIYHVVWYRPICPTGNKMLPDGSACKWPAGAACYQQGCLPLHDWLPLMGQMGLWRRWRSAFDRVVANSYAVKAALVADGIEPVEVIWNGVPEPDQPVAVSLAAVPTVVVAGRLTVEKGVDVLLRAIAQAGDRLPDTRLLVAGDGPELGNLRSLAGELGIAHQVNFLGHLPHSQMEQQFAGAWVQVVPSRWAEPFGFVAPEAMMRSIPVIASGSGGLAEIVKPSETGFLVPPGDATALAEALVKVLSDRALAQRLGKAGRARALTHFSEQVWLDQFVSLYESLGQTEHRPALEVVGV